MNFIDEMYEMYRNKLTGEDEDAVALVLSLLEEHDRKDLIKMIQEMTDSEIYQMVAMYLIEMLKAKMAQDGIGEAGFTEPDSRLH